MAQPEKICHTIETTKVWIPRNTHKCQVCAAARCNSRLRRWVPRASWTATLSILVSSEFDWVPASVSKVEEWWRLSPTSTLSRHMDKHMHMSQRTCMHTGTRVNTWICIQERKKQTMKSHPCDTCLNLVVCDDHRDNIKLMSIIQIGNK